MSIWIFLKFATKWTLDEFEESEIVEQKSVAKKCLLKKKIPHSFFRTDINFANKWTLGQFEESEIVEQKSAAKKCLLKKKIPLL